MQRIRYITLLMLIGAFALFSSTTVFSNEGWKDKEQVLNEVDRANKAFENIEADLTYTKIIPLLEVHEVSNGEIRYKKPDKAYIKFTAPRNEINVIDGEYVWIFHPEARQVEKYRTRDKTQAPQGMSFFELGYKSSVAEANKRYEISLIEKKVEKGKRFYVLELIPKANQADDRYSKIHLWIEEGFWLPSVIELFESEGEVLNKIELNNISLNKPIPDKIFQFVVPKGVEVVEPFK
ncbi:MAG TPA: outer membrane lipoprotein carrier protein LolA [Candidatus Brocadiales bacterium]|nr:outer membrane lipoprotein carrier protein LolA [Candidatus Brocadiales bacterium]